MLHYFTKLKKNYLGEEVWSVSEVKVKLPRKLKYQTLDA